MKYMYATVALVFGFVGTDAMDCKSRVRLSEKKLVKRLDSDEERKHFLERYRMNILFNGMMATIYIVPLAFKKVRQQKNTRTIASIAGCAAMAHAYLLYNNVKEYDLIKRGLRWHREIIVE